MTTLTLSLPLPHDVPSSGFQPLPPQARRRVAAGVLALHVVALLAIGLSRAPSIPSPAARDLGLVWVSTAAPPAPQPPEPPLPRPVPPKVPLAALTLPLPEIVVPAADAPRPPPAAVASAAPSDATVANPSAAAPAVSALRPPAPAAVEPPPGPRTVAISAVQYLSPPQLQYPLASKRLREQGLVQVRLLVDEQGRPQQATVVRSSGFERLDEAALGTARATRFKPYAEDGVARPFWVVMPLVFELQA